LRFIEITSMCGIFGYIGTNTKATKIVFDGLKTLEYRGYDSWGIAVKNPEDGNKNHKSLLVEKEIGKLPPTLPHSSTLNLNSTLALGHTRWATHGGVTVANSHPHLDCNKQIAVVHNGIIENYQELRDELIKKGHKFLSETDSEVAAHLIEENLKTTGFATSVKNAFNRFSGMNAIVVLNAASSEIIAAKNGSPLVVGIGDNEFFLASDAAGILQYTKKVLFVEDHQMVILGKNLQLLSLPSGNKIQPTYTTLNWKFEETQMGKYKHFFIKEIHEEARIIENTALNGLLATKILADLINNAYGTFLIACGSASYAAISATYLFSKIAKKHVNFIIGSEFNYIEDFLTEKTLIIPISQSGESIDVIEPVTRAKKEKNVKIASIVNVLGSTLYRLSDFNVLLESGPEKAVVATKSFTAMIATIILTAYTLAGKQNKGRDLLLQAAKNVKHILSDDYITKVKKIAEKLKKNEHIYIIGRGISYTAALEATLKIKEASYAHAEAFPGGELKHGVIALIEKGTPIIVFAPDDETYYDIISNAEEIKARGGYIIGIGPKNNEVFDEFLETDNVEEATLLPQVTISHLLGYYLALARGNKDPDKPRNLAKSVTVK
jgi:glucosamine--fructose-6-phosphate aminotransferase (isomerizing)